MGAGDFLAEDPNGEVIVPEKTIRSIEGAAEPPAECATECLEHGVLVLLGKSGEEGQQVLIACGIEVSLFLQHTLRFIRKTEGYHVLGLHLINLRVGKDSVVGFRDIGSLG